ncbi:hypothetical protein HanRHA438_Chr15g0693041 [Helianthus annuus]|uniref:Uncharacterized protein n=1 Tax=Helianthus annuus TaxID=4232 RepID=A0A9K3H201_HELAN|nr:hypothetical protein HanXRQr2_Chr15g0680851 [Helianthus annuus]KAJ0450318.1 hypothetical protein HanHA300_Chr15g0554971 [Helianthus annuus]KAJ0454390.1 hypothetical protein HanIR_Chr15g0739521 [Helianthus annuus]KAJ0472144.1 hypothetical protein HanHA89_Chr15g0603721 [Helianthus annuus]KAJ0647741.1 hypothetical protein HanLR1_Chr15g0565031 [Helianthus annuus]
MLVKSTVHQDLCQLFRVDSIRFCSTWCVYEALRVRNRAAKKHALEIPLICDHQNNPIRSWDCVKGVLKSEVRHPLFFASSQRRTLCRVMRV